MTGEEEGSGQVPAEGEEREPTVACLERPCAGVDSYNTEELTRVLGLIKDQYPDDENVILVPESRVQYEVIVATMDAAREDVKNKTAEGSARLLFPFVVMPAGQR